MFQEDPPPLLIILIGGVRKQFPPSSLLHSSQGRSISFRCSDADVSDEEEEEEAAGSDGANHELHSEPSLCCQSSTFPHRLAPNRVTSDPPLSYVLM